MAHFNIRFTHPWLLLLLVPAIGLALFSLFRVNRRFRCHRNRVISFVLGICTLVSAVLLVAGLNFSCDRRNENQMLLLVDQSASSLSSQHVKDEYVRGIIENAPPKTDVGVVLFGYDPVTAVPFGTEKSEALDLYETALKQTGHDDAVQSAGTYISQALTFAGEQFRDPKLSKIILITDGLETDGDARKTLTELSLKGIQIDLIHAKNSGDAQDIRPVEVVTPKKAVMLQNDTDFELRLFSDIQAEVTVKMMDNGRTVAEQAVRLMPGVTGVPFTHSFAQRGLHELTFEIESPEDGETRNNRICSFVYIETVNRMLILERDQEGEALVNLFKDQYEMDRLHIRQAPMDLNALRAYDQVVLCNIANADMPEGFVDILDAYVHIAGGGLLTVGGTRRSAGEDVANTYNRADMKDTKFQDMLPVLAEDYRPPVAVILVIDISLSMMMEMPGTNQTYMDVAKENALIGLDTLDPRDYVGIVTFGDSSTLVLPPTPAVQKGKIEQAIRAINYNMEGTVYAGALERAGVAARTVEDISKRHIILISDGSPSSNDLEYIRKTRKNYQSGVTTSVISFGSNVAIPEMEQVASVGHGNSYIAVNGDKLAAALKDELESELITDFNMETFRPVFGADTSIFAGVKEKDIPQLDGFFGVKLRKGVNASMVGNYHQPIYAEWDYGKGKVGSFMCDLNGLWSETFLKDRTGQKILGNILSGLFPPRPVRDRGIEIQPALGNAELVVHVYSPKPHETVRLTVEKAGSGLEVGTVEFTEFDGNASARFDLPEPGVYRITTQGFNNTHQMISENTVYEAAPMLAEYDTGRNLKNDPLAVEEMAAAGVFACVRHFYWRCPPCR